MCIPRDEIRLAPNPLFQATLPLVYKNPFRKIGPYCSLGLVTGRARPMDIRVAMTNSLGFRGKNASLIFARSVPN
jgi:3-oxoacyl-(acyl-carrier-protein) synthase